ncbi:formylglycine-generating enzyme family protein [Steroidobacter sp.]|uniref:formylglycine-generating enzyme family protein n=1 Tax=Steroidobacter sp. TaxID=1978227 RepID=UPI001A3D9AE8|nr:SUMF1/EgtB/PvdO family nonheme iron enzyme [Steroidobacter sp.]MBL8271131.1 SUMF1/EgtB/PvdO family nonheme iron enzyme [Steroidobacter sp.]
MSGRLFAPRAWLLPAMMMGMATIAGPAAATESFSDCDICPRMQAIAPGSFDMGAEKTDKEASEDEWPMHKVTIAKQFAVGVREVSRDEFAAFVTATRHDMGRSCNVMENNQWGDLPGRSWLNPGYAQTGQHPVVCVSWNDAQAYVRWLSERTGKRYRLLTESEWEYVARKGLRASVPVSHEMANYGAESDSFAPLASGRDRWLQTAPGGSFPADALVLYDVRGTVWERIEDCYHEDYFGATTEGSARTECSMADRRAVRGGGWGDASKLLRPSYRLRGPAAERYFSLGFRVARD